MIFNCSLLLILGVITAHVSQNKKLNSPETIIKCSPHLKLFINMSVCTPDEQITTLLYLLFITCTLSGVKLCQSHISRTIEQHMLIKIRSYITTEPCVLLLCYIILEMLISYLYHYILCCIVFPHRRYHPHTLK